MVTKDDVKLAVQPNSSLTPGFAYFNDTFRDAVKGGVFNASEKGFVSGASGKEFTIFRGFTGRCSWCKTPLQSVNYAACHDNNTLYDRLTLSADKGSDLAAMNRLAAAITLTSDGIPFMMSGEEMLRSKKNADGTFNENSYNAGDAVNALDYSTLSDGNIKTVNDYYKGLIEFRKAHLALRATDVAVIDKAVKRIEGIGKNIVGIAIDGTQIAGETASSIFVVFNADTADANVELPEGKWGIYVNDTTAGTKRLKTVSGKVNVKGISAMVLIKEGEGSVVNPWLIAGIAGAGVVLAAALFVILFGRKKNPKKDK